MSKKIRYGDQVYIEISNNLSPPDNEARLLCSNGYLDETLFGVKSQDQSKASFRNCIFTITPSLVDSKEDLKILSSLRTELSFLSLHKPDSLGEKYLTNEISSKEKQIELGKDNIEAINKKILEEMDGKKVYFGDVVLLQHLESGYYLTADSSYHPNNPTLNNLRLRKGRTPACYFKFFSYLSSSERSYIDYECEMKLISTYLNTAVTMGSMKSRIPSLIMNNSKSQGDVDYPNFPADNLRRENIITSFEGEPLAIGTSLDSNDNHRIKLVEFCSREDLTTFKKKKIIKNGDYVRFQIDDFYLTASKSIYRQNFGLVQQKHEGYEFNFINSIFQIIQANPEHAYAKGTEIQSLPKNAAGEEETSRYYLKHLVTGEYLSIPEKQLFNSVQAEHNSPREEAPVFSLINNELKQKISLTKNSKVLLKVFGGKDQPAQFYRQGDVEEYKTQQVDLNSKYFVGFKNSEDKIKAKLKLLKKSIIGNEASGSYFRVNLVNEDEMRKIFEFESYANAVKQFMRVYHLIARQSFKVTPESFEHELGKMIQYSEKLISLTTTHDTQVQILIREFKILDQLAKLIYYLVLNDDLKNIMTKKTFRTEQLIQLLTNFCNILLNVSKDNELSHIYISQYVRIFILCLLDSSPLSMYYAREESESLKNIMVEMLGEFLSELDLDAFGQLAHYESLVFKNLDHQRDYSIHTLEVLNHYFRNQVVNSGSSLKENFIKQYIGNPQRIKKIFPKITSAGAKAQNDDFAIEFSRDGYPAMLLFSDAGDEVQNYLVWVFKLISSIAKMRSLKFWNVIINYYPEELCENLLSSPKVHAKLKTNILSMVKSVHFAYNKLPFDRIPPNIQILLPQETIDKWQTNFDKQVRDAQSDLISQTELNLIKKSSPKFFQSSVTGINTMSSDILNDGYEQIYKGNLDSFPFVLQVMKNLVREEGDSMSQSLWIIHESLGVFFEKAADELQNGKRRYYYNACVKNIEKILFIITEIDKNIVKLAFAELIESLKGKVLKQYVSSLQTGTKGGRYQEKVEVISIIKSMSAPWKSKEKLYEIAGKSKSSAFTESRFLRALWKIVESEEDELTSGFITLIKEKANFEAKVTKELGECAFIAEQNELSDFDQLISSLLTLNKIGRRLRLNDEFDLKAQEDRVVLDEIIENLEKVFLAIYDFEMHMAEENQGLSKEEAQKGFLGRFRYSKLKSQNEIPFRHKGVCIKIFYQKIMRFLNGHEIILSFINNLINKQVMFKNCKEERFKQGYCVAMVILILFMHKNTINQYIMAESPEFINLFHITNFRETSTEAIFLFTEMCRENKHILKLEKDYLFNIAVHDFVSFYNSFTSESGSPAAINYIRSLPTIISSQIPQDIFDSGKFMMNTLFDFFQYISTNKPISLQKLINNSSHLRIQHSNTVGKSSWETQNSELKVLDMPIFYVIFKEFLDTQRIFALTEDKGSVRIMQSSLTLEKILPYFKNENVEFNFQIKQTILQILENINFKNVHKNTNLFLDFEQFNSFISLLFIDIYGYLRNSVDIKDKIFDVFSTANFAKTDCMDFMAKYDKLLETDLNNIAFLQYQALTIITQSWKKYVYYVLCEFFENLLSTYKTFMLTTKEKSTKYTSAFENWLELVIKLRELDKDPASRSSLDEALKKVVTHSEYADKRELVYSLLEGEKATPERPSQLTSPKSTVNGDLEGLIGSVIGNKSNFKNICVEENLHSIVLELGLNKPVFKRLIDIVATPDTNIKTSVFVLKMLRKVVEVENMTKENNMKPIYLWKDVSEIEFENINYNQLVLNDLGVVKAVFNMLYEHPGEKKILKQILLLCIALLYGGNKEVQDQFYIEFLDDLDNEILGNFSQILEETLENLRIKESQKTQESYVSALQFIFNYLYENNELSFDKQTGSVKIPESLKEKLAHSYNQSLEVSRFRVSIERDDYDFLLIVLEFLQTLCEGHHLKFQEFLRDQSLVEHSKSFNIPEFLRQAYHVYYKYVTMSNIETGVKILDLLTEIQQGASQENVELLLKKTFISDLCNTMNGFNTNLDLLSRGFGFDSNHPAFMNLKSKALVIIKDLVERSEPEKLKKLCQYLDIKALVSTFKENVLTFHKKRKGVYPTRSKLVTPDIWEPSLLNAFSVYHILKHVSFEETNGDLAPQILQAFKEINKDESTSNTDIMNRYLYDFFKAYTGSVEILDSRLDKLMKIYFPIPAVYYYLKSDTKLEFANRVDRSNTQTKIADLMDSSTELIGQMYIEYYSRNRLFGLNFNNAYNFIRFFTNLLAIVIVCIDLFGLEYVDGEVNYKHETVNDVNDALSAFQAVLGCVLALLWLQTKLSRSLAFKWDEFVSNNVKQMGPLSPDVRMRFIQKEPLTQEDGKAILLLKGPYSEEWHYVKKFMQSELTWYNLLFTLKSGAFLWHIIYFAVCIGSIFHPLVTAFQLFDIVVRSDTVTRITLSISRNLSQFLWTLVLMLVTIYVYMLIGFYFLHDRYENDDVGGDLCPDAYSCYLSSLNQGLRTGGGIADSLQMTIYNRDDKGDYFLQTLFDLSNFIIIITLLLNLIFGMIIDAFGDLRDEKTTNEDDKKNVCFICGIPRSEYERTGNFDTHMEEEHDYWKYIAYLVYLMEKEKNLKTDLTDVEDFVRISYEKKDFSWVPVGRSLTLERLEAKEEKEKKSEIDSLRDDINLSFDKMMEQNKKMLTRMEEMMAYSAGQNQNQNQSSGKHQTNNFVKNV